jgi:superfamily II DNA/RNA helicase
MIEVIISTLLWLLGYIGLYFSFIQRLASDFLSKYIFITVGRVGSSTDLITQKLEFVTNDEKKNYLLDLLQEQSFCSTDGKVLFVPSWM